MARFHKSLRQTVEANNAADRYYAAMAGKKPQAQTILAPKRARTITTHSTAPPFERDVLKAVWKYLASHKRIAWITRINSGAIMADFGASGIHPLRLNYKRGMSDLVGQMKDGRFLAVECKREGAELMDHQRDFLNEVLANNGVAFVARCIEDCERALR